MNLTNEQRKILNNFGLGILQDMVNVMTSLENKGIQEQDVREAVIFYVQEEKNKVKEQSAQTLKQQEKSKQDYKSKAPQCPKCHAPLMIREIKAPKGVKNLNNYKSEWYCINDEIDCIYEKYSVKTVQEELKEKGIINKLPTGQPVVGTSRVVTEGNISKTTKSKKCHGCG